MLAASDLTPSSPFRKYGLHPPDRLKAHSAALHTFFATGKYLNDNPLR
jgi:hypothetical protein